MQASELWPRLFLGASYDATNKAQLQQHKITHIVNVAEEIRNFFEDQPDNPFAYKRLRWQDDDAFPIANDLETVADWIHNALAQGGIVLVHCMMGKSRSTAAVLAYAIKYLQPLQSTYELLKHIKTKRAIAQPNDGFLLQLATFERVIGWREKLSSFLHPIIYLVVADYLCNQSLLPPWIPSWKKSHRS